MSPGFYQGEQSMKRQNDVLGPQTRRADVMRWATARRVSRCNRAGGDLNIKGSAQIIPAVREPRPTKNHQFTCWNRAATVSAFSRELKADTRKKPSP
jgi:hypothetical protein